MPSSLDKGRHRDRQTIWQSTVHTTGFRSTDDHEDIQEMDFIYGKIVEKYPTLKAEPFYARVQEIQNMGSGDKVKWLKDASDKLLKNIRSFLSDEQFIHRIHD